MQALVSYVQKSRAYKSRPTIRWCYGIALSGLLAICIHVSNNLTASIEQKQNNYAENDSFWLVWRQI